MNYKFKYSTDSEMTSILANNMDKYLIEVANITEGNFLIFSDNTPSVVIQPETITILKSEYEDLQNQLLLAVNENIEGGIF